MGLVSTHPRGLAVLPDAGPVCRCGHCRTVIDATPRRRRVRCSSCGRINTVPAHVRVACERCHHDQRVRFTRCNSGVLCANCAGPLEIREIELIARRRRLRRGGRDKRHVSKHDRIVSIVLLYALVLLFFLLWVSLT